MIQIVETPRDAMQGIRQFIPTHQKIQYINTLLRVGFDIIDFGSFVSPRAVPQLRDTSIVLSGLDVAQSNTKLLSIIGNVRGANEAGRHQEIAYLGYPHSISPRFLELNLNSSVMKSRGILAEILNVADRNDKKTLVYVSMAFGSPYQEEWCIEQVFKECLELEKLGVEDISLADTTGISNPDQVGDVFGMLASNFPDIQFGLHLHACNDCWYDKLDAAYQNGCTRFDGVLNGLGGCPFTGYEMIGNLKTGHILKYLDDRNIQHHINRPAFEKAKQDARGLFEQLTKTD